MVSVCCQATHLLAQAEGSAVAGSAMQTNLMQHEQMQQKRLQAANVCDFLAAAKYLQLQACCQEKQYCVLLQAKVSYKKMRWQQQTGDNSDKMENLTEIEQMRANSNTNCT